MVRVKTKNPNQCDACGSQIQLPGYELKHEDADKPQSVRYYYGVVACQACKNANKRLIVTNSHKGE
jgi:hypothetical protein